MPDILSYIRLFLFIYFIKDFNMYILPIDEFFLLFCDYKKRITIFIYSDFEVLSLNRFKNIPDKQSFILCGTEYVKKHYTIEKRGN